MAITIGVHGSHLAKQLKDPGKVQDGSLYIPVHTRSDRLSQLVNLTDLGAKFLVEDDFNERSDFLGHIND